MKKLFPFKKICLACFATLGLLSSCEQVIDYELRKADEKIVIEGLITDQPGADTIRISRTKGYLEQGQTPRINHATVIVTDNEGTADTLQAIGNGKYITTKLEGKVGNSYFLKAVVDGETYTAQSTMQPVGPIDTVTYVFRKGNAGRKEGYYPSMKLQELPGLGNYYLFEFYINDEKTREFTPIDDVFYEGNEAEVEVGYVLQANDKFRIVMSSLDKPAFDFYVGLQNQLYNTGGPFDPIPANTKSNISNGAIGLFRASAVASYEIVIK